MSNEGTMLFVNIFLSFFLVIYSLSAQESAKEATCEPVKTSYSLANLRLKDLSNKIFQARIRTIFDEAQPDKLLSKYLLPVMEDNKYVYSEKDKLKIKEIKDLYIYVGDIRTRYVRGSYDYFVIEGDENSFHGYPYIDLEFIYTSDQMPVGKTCVSLRDGEGDILSNISFEMPELNSGTNQQPIIEEIVPLGAVPRETITIRGKNLGTDIDKIKVYFISPIPKEDYEFKEKELGIATAYFLSAPDEKGIQEIKVSVPDSIVAIEPMKSKDYFGKTIYIKLISNYRPSMLKNFTLLHKRWKLVTGLLTLVFTFCFLGAIAYLSKTTRLFSKIFIDKKTGTYSLSNFQSFSWTVVLMGSYLYYAICKGILLEIDELPEFSYSLVGLMGISYGGLLTSKFVDKKIELTTKTTPPEWKDLFCDRDGNIELAKLQLFLFTVISLLVYVFYLFRGNVLKGLPEIPETLHTLLLTSQGGYIGGKAVTSTLKSQPTSNGTGTTNPKIEAIATEPKNSTENNVEEPKSRKPA